MKYTLPLFFFPAKKSAASFTPDVILAQIIKSLSSNFEVSPTLTSSLGLLPTDRISCHPHSQSNKLRGVLLTYKKISHLIYFQAIIATMARYKQASKNPRRSAGGSTGGDSSVVGRSGTVRRRPAEPQRRRKRRMRPGKKYELYVCLEIIQKI
jgi:hypothetical protein